jgi:hypothetical protein
MLPPTKYARVGLHTGEYVIGEKISGLAGHIGARIAGLAPPARCWCRRQ